MAILDQIVHPNAVIGKDVTVGYGTIIEDDVIVGDNCTIGHHVVLKSGTRMGKNVAFADYCCTTGLCYIGNDVAVRTRSTISKGVIVEDRAFIGAGVMMSHTKNIYHHRPRMWKKQLITIIGMGAIVGSHSNLRAGVEIGNNVVIGYNSHVTQNLPAAGIYYGNPARLIKELPPEMVVAQPEGWRPYRFSEEMLEKYLPYA